MLPLTVSQVHFLDYVIEHLVEVVVECCAHAAEAAQWWLTTLMHIVEAWEWVYDTVEPDSLRIFIWMHACMQSEFCVT